MANTAQARKRVRQSESRRQLNASHRSMMRTYLKKTLAAIKSGDVNAANEAFKKSASVIDKMASKGLVHKNKAARHKSRLTAKVKAMAA
tara:strand:- start:13823 stop:14089 length:267 start_codon:yes stop_codon:yes gene_type:complete